MRAARPATFQVLRESRAPAWLGAQAGSGVRAAFAAPEPVDAVDDRARQVEAMIEAARAEAVAEGRARGEAAGRAQWEPAVAELRAVLAELDGLQGRVLGALEDLILELATTIARVLLERELAEDPALVARLVREAVSLIGESEAFEVRVPPALHARLGAELRASGAGAEDAPARAEAIRLLPDPAVEAGCVVETRLARVDATLAARLRTLSDALRQGQEEAP